MYVKLSALAKVVLAVAVVLSLAAVYFRWHLKAVFAAGAQQADVQASAGSTEYTLSTLDEGTTRKLLRVLAEERNELDVPSLQAAVIIRGKGRWTGSVGWAGPREKRAATVRDLYHVGSVSKLYTAAVILRLVQDGKLSLADPVGKFIPGIPNGEKITIRQLLNHTSGLYNYTESLPFLLKTVLLHHKWTLEEILQIVKGHRPYFEPGARHYYSNSNFVLLGKIAEEAGGQPFSVLLKAKVLTPLGLKNTFFAPQEDLPKGTVRGYDVTLLGLGKLGIKKDMESLRIPFEASAFTAGGIVGNASDVAQFAYGLFEGSILDEASLEAMCTFVDALDEDVPEQTGYGLGVRRLKIGGVELIGHTGIFPGFSNVSMYSPEKGYVVTVLSNLSTVRVNRVIEKIQTEVLDGI